LSEPSIKRHRHWSIAERGHSLGAEQQPERPETQPSPRHPGRLRAATWEDFRMREVEIETPSGLARAHLQAANRPRGAVILGHGAGGGIGAKDLQAASEAAQAQSFTVALVEQPYRVAGRRTPAPAAQLDAAWRAVVERLARKQLRGLALVFGGRSLGARVACRSAEAGGAVGVLCLAFPLLPPGRASSRKPPQSRLPELDAVEVPTLVIQGTRDPFGMPPSGPLRTVVEVAGDHSLRSDLGAIRDAVGAWLARLSVRASGL
jgi:predicted alpha/beta-hydrolase family hydrolase